MKLGELWETVKRLSKAAEKDRDSFREELHRLQSGQEEEEEQRDPSAEKHLEDQLSLHESALDALSHLASELDKNIQNRGHQAEAPKELVDLCEEIRRILAKGSTGVSEGVANNNAC